MKTSNELLINDKKKTEFIENLIRLNREQAERIKLQEEALIQADKMASLGQLVAGIVHEINNPTTYIRANIELLKKYWRIILKNTNITENSDISPFIANYEEILDSMCKGTDNIMDIVSGIKFFARQEKVVYDVFDINHCIIEACKLVKNEFIKNKVNLVNRTEKNKFLVNGSFQQLEQIFVNLMMNALTAIKGSDSATNGIVEIEIIRTENYKLNIFVRDNGCGIAEKNIGKIFNSFFTTNQASGGTGLGLTIVYRIVKEHSGDIKVRSQENKGTEFIIQLPEYRNL
jgi:signal transduction histidine kinase